MSREDDRTPLLLDIDDSHVEYNTAGNVELGKREISSRVRSASEVLLGELRDTKIVCVFVVAFDTRAGNLIEWCAPDDCVLDGIEFKAMASGCHRVHKDFIYFKQDSLYGLSCFENMPVESEIERGARMKSVGVLATSYFSLYSHMEFLEDQVRHLLEYPGNYDTLQEFYETWKAILPCTVNGDDCEAETCQTLRPVVLPKAAHPIGCYSQFVNFFGEQIFLLWKALLLKKRILFYSPPPIGVVCYRVYCSSCLVLHDTPEIIDKIIHPLFYVSVGDVDYLENQINYVACTTDKILEGKPHLYDMYVDNQNVQCSTHNLQKIISINSADKDKLLKLSTSLRQLPIDQTENENSEEMLFTDYFRNLNNNLFRVLLDVSYSQDKQLTSNHIRSVGLDPVGDRNFLIQLLDTYGIDAIIMTDSPCCA